MESTFRLLLIEDSDDDAALILRQLQQGGYTVVSTQVATAQAMRAALNQQAWDVIVADYAMPQFSAPAALTLMRELGLDLPFLIVSSAIDDEMAVSVLKAGAHDFILKHNLARLVPAVRRELREAAARHAQAEAEAAATRHAARTQILLRFAARLLGLDLPGILDAACQESAAALGVSIASVRLYDAQRDIFDFAHGIGLPEVYTACASPIARSALALSRSTDQLVLVDDIQTQPGADTLPDSSFYQALGLRTVVIAEMQHDGTVLGCLCVASHDTIRVFSDDELSLLQGIADQAAMAIISAHRLNDANRRLQRLGALRTIDSVLMSSHELYPTLDAVLAQSRQQLHTDAAAILLLDEPTQHFTFIAGHGFHSDAITHARMPMHEAYASVVAIDRCIYRTVALPNEAAFSRSTALEDENFVTYYGVPLMVKEQPRGVLELFHRTPLHLDSEAIDFLHSLAEQAAIAIDNATLFAHLQNSHAELATAYDATLEGWVRALDLRAQESPGHTERVTEATVTLAAAMGVPEAELIHIQRGALLHDVGKLGLPDHVLRKPSELSADEWTMMHQHPLYAYEWLSPIAFLRPALDIPRYHHEYWDGTGYPYGLSGEDIPLAARIFAVIDVWDALRSHRAYRPAWPDEQVKGHLWELAGTHLDPQIVAVFLMLEPHLIERDASH